MVLLGALVNGVSVIVGSLLGRMLQRIPDSLKDTIMKAMGLAIIILGIQMGMKSEHYLLVIISLVVGGIAGEVIAIDHRLNQLGSWIESKAGSSQGNGISQGFVTATLVFVIGAMAIVGSLDSGIRGNHDVLFTKSIMDGVIAAILATTLGIGVLLSFVPVVLYEGGIALFATQVHRFVPDELMNQSINEMTSVGGIMILGIGTNLLGITRIKIANLIPAILVIVIIMYLM
ncbi:DUF554 domain-containing protein [Paenibacillus sp. JX-17]|uniref:DUF554 domain-containing protein n=1 Tax=Paenibacillus lacisoli TaxID=3064525 RepID=A0ABT9CAX1_9BACL|nr:DUF554 domain-containing protein [Paenibacillus sp. JX-17]MDO7904841.1 DUF554 domain-containing protein [Paenibacillus sp. JX-17]